MILGIKTDQKIAEIHLVDSSGKAKSIKWEAHMKLSETIHRKIQSFLKQNGKDWHDIEGVVFYEGPGSFTGLRIGASVVNALGSGLSVPVVGTSGNNWFETGVKKLGEGSNEDIVLPKYGAEPHITKPKK